MWLLHLLLSLICFFWTSWQPFVSFRALFFNVYTCFIFNINFILGWKEISIVGWNSLIIVSFFIPKRNSPCNQHRTKRHQIIQRNKFCLNKYLLLETRCKKKRLCEKFINCYSVVINFKQIKNDVFVNVEVGYIF